MTAGEGLDIAAEYPVGRRKRGVLAVNSMTGFARSDATEAGYSWAWEVKSVNSKGLDLRFRLPSGFDPIETAARTLASQAFSRGNLSINLNLQRPEKLPELKVNRALLDQMVALVAEFRGGAAPGIESLLGLRGSSISSKTRERTRISSAGATKRSWRVSRR